MELWWPCAAVPHPPLNVCSVVVCPHSAAERRQHAVRHGTCGLRLTQPVTSAARWCVHITPQPSLCEAVRPMRPPVQARCERFVLLPAGQPCEPIPSPQRPVLHPPSCALLPPVGACVRACVCVCGCNLAPKQRLCGQGSVGSCACVHRVSRIALLLGSLWGKTKEGNRIKWHVPKHCLLTPVGGGRLGRAAHVGGPAPPACVRARDSVK